MRLPLGAAAGRAGATSALCAAAGAGIRCLQAGVHTVTYRYTVAYHDIPLHDIVVFKQESPYTEYFYSLLTPWEHYVPVADSLHDLPARVALARDHAAEAAAIAARAQLALARLHLHDIACFWWQLLSAMAPLQTHQARGVANGFVAFVE